MFIFYLIFYIFFALVVTTRTPELVAGGCKGHKEPQASANQIWSIEDSQNVSCTKTFKLSR